jgi:hypothetical protein
MPRITRGPVEQAVRRDLEAAKENLRAPSGLAASALALAQLLDGNSPLTARDAATVATELRQTLAELARRKPAQPQEDSIAKRRARRAAARGAAG